MKIAQQEGLTMEAQVVELGLSKVGARSRMRFALAEVVHSGPSHAVQTAPAGKGSDDTVKINEQFICWEIDAEGNAIKGSFASPRAKDFVAKNFEEIEGFPGHYRKAAITAVYEVPNDWQGAVTLMNREGKEQEVVPGCLISADDKGYCHVIERAKFDKDFDVFPDYYKS
jgi:hypothetical protein